MKPKTITKLGAGTLAVVAIASLVGSISGTIAWFQYTTRVTANYTGVVSHATENLEISLDGQNWKTNLTEYDVQSYLFKEGRKDTKLHPVTTGVQADDGKLDGLYKNPIYQYGNMGSWGKADAANDYITLPFQVRVRDIDGTNDSFLGKNIYLTALSIDETSDNAKYDISDALRVHVETPDKAATFSKTGNDVTPYGKLDLNGDHIDDAYDQFDLKTGDVNYGHAEYATLPATLNRGDYIDYSIAGGKKWDYASQAWVDDPAAPATHKYYVWDGSHWGEETTEPTVANPAVDPTTKFRTVYTKVKTVTNADDLKTALAEVFYEGDVVKVSGKFYRYARTKHNDGGYVLSWQEIAGATAAESYALDDAGFLADDSDPHNIIGTPIAKTNGKVAAFADLLAKDDYALVTSENVYYQYDGTAWTSVGGTAPATGAPRGSYDTKAALPTNTIGDVVYVADQNATFIWKTVQTVNKWVPNADHDVSNPVSLPDPKDAVIGDTYYDGSGIKESNGVEWTTVKSASSLAITINVTIYLEGWQQLPSKEETALPTSADRLIPSGTVYKVNTDFYTWDGYEFRDGKWKYSSVNGWKVDDSLTENKTVSTLPTDLVLIGETYSIDDGTGTKHLLHWDGAKWAEGGYSIWDAANYVDAKFSIGFRFSAEAHTDHN